jgi:hypothetical protein
LLNRGIFENQFGQVSSSAVPAGLILQAIGSHAHALGRKDDNVYGGDKFPAYPETEFFRSQFSRALNGLLRLDDCSIDGAISRVGATVSDRTQRIFRRQLFVDVDAETRFAAAV